MRIPDKIFITDKEVSEYARRNKLLAPKYIRKFVSTALASLEVPESVIDFIQGRVPSKILARHYLGLVSLADRYYHRYAKYLRKILP